jgi:hypothetical protein
MLKPKSIDSIRDLAVQLEATDIEAAHALMEMAHTARPNGQFIEQKLRRYKQKIEETRAHLLRLAELHKTGAAAIIPIGFRCLTAEYLRHAVGVAQYTLPFDVGFFPPTSVASILDFPQVSLCFQDRSSFDICRKHENRKHPIHGDGIWFRRSSKEEIDSIVRGKDKSAINQYLDSTFGYYTLDNRHNYVLAHYNWHTYADNRKSGGCTDMPTNLQNASNILNRRIDRMMKLCHASKIAIFIFYNPQNYRHMRIDEEICDLTDLSAIKEAAQAIFKSKAHVVTDVELIESQYLREQVAKAAI